MRTRLKIHTSLDNGEIEEYNKVMMRHVIRTTAVEMIQHEKEYL